MEDNSSRKNKYMMHTPNALYIIDTIHHASSLDVSCGSNDFEIPSLYLLSNLGGLPEDCSQTPQVDTLQLQWKTIPSMT